MPTKPTVCFVESLGFLEEQSHSEGEIISRTLRLSHKNSAYAYIKNIGELEAITEEFGHSDHRYLHLSCHGLVNNKDKAIGFALTTDTILNKNLADLLAPHMKGRRLFLSSCLVARSNFAKMLLKRSECLSVLAPMNEIAFDDAAVFWTSFYHLMFKTQPNAMSNRHIKNTVRICAELVSERFRLFWQDKESGKIKSVTIGPSIKKKSAVE